MKELQAVLELSRVRADSQVMRGDAYRVARYFRHQWAGIAPLPGETTIVLKVERTPVPDKVPEPITVVVSTSSWDIKTISLWR